MQSLQWQTSAILLGHYCDVIMFSDINLNDSVPCRPVQPVYIKRENSRFLSFPRDG